MKKLRQFLYVAALALFATSCGDIKDDIHELQKGVEELGNRITTVEDAVKSMQDDIDAGKFITTVESVVDPDTGANGFKISYSDNTSKTFYNGLNSDTPVVWVNAAGNWAMNLGRKPADSDDAKYEFKVAGASVPAVGEGALELRTDSYVDASSAKNIWFRFFDPTTEQYVGDGVKSNYPTEGGKIITAVVENDEHFVFTIYGKDFLIPRAIALPESMTLLQAMAVVEKGKTTSFNLIVSPETIKGLKAEAFGLFYVETYKSRSAGVVPEFIKIKSVALVAGTKSEYTVELEWNGDFPVKDQTTFPVDAALFVTLQYNGIDGKESKLVSETPLILTEKYVRITEAHVDAVKSFFIFADEKMVDSVRLLKGYHENYIKSIEFVQTNNSIESCATLGRYTALNPSDRYKFSYDLSNSCAYFPTTGERVWPVSYRVDVTDLGVADRPAVAGDPTTGRPGIPEIKGLDPVTISRTFTASAFHVPAYISDWAIGTQWIPAASETTWKSYDMSTDLTNFGYSTKTSESWTYSLVKFTIAHTGGNAPFAVRDYNAAGDVVTLGFDAATKKLSVARSILIDHGDYEVIATITATGKNRHKSLPEVRTIKARITFSIKEPVIHINLKDATIDANVAATNIYTTYKNLDVAMATLFDAAVKFDEGNAADYQFATGAGVLGSQGIKFETVSPSVAADYSVLNVLKPASGAEWTKTVNMKAFVELKSGRKVTVAIRKTNNTTVVNATGLFKVQFIKSTFVNVTLRTQKEFKMTYAALAANKLDIVHNEAPNASVLTFKYNATGTPNLELDPSTVAKVVYSVPNTVSGYNFGDIPVGLEGKNMIAVDAATGLVTATNAVTNWSGIGMQVVRITVTDIWGTERQCDAPVVFSK